MTPTQTPDPNIKLVNDLSDEELYDYTASLSFVVSLSTKDIAPPNKDEDKTVLDLERLTNDGSSPVGTICKKAKGMVHISIFNPNGLRPEQLAR